MTVSVAAGGPSGSLRSPNASAAASGRSQMWHATTSRSERAPAQKSLKIFWLTIDALFLRRRRPSAPVKYQ